VKPQNALHIIHNITNIADVMGVSEVLLCPYRCLEYKMVRLEELKIQLRVYSRFLIILLPNCI